MIIFLARNFSLVSFPSALTRGLVVARCRVEELALPTRAIQLSGEVLSTHEAASAELRKAEAAHWTRSSHHLFKAAPTTPCVSAAVVRTGSTGT